MRKNLSCDGVWRKQTLVTSFLTRKCLKKLDVSNPKGNRKQGRQMVKHEARKGKNFLHINSNPHVINIVNS